MTLFKRGVVSVFAVFVFLFGSAIVASAEGDDLYSLVDLELTNEQTTKIGGTIEEYFVKKYTIISDIENKLFELGVEIRREGRFDTKRNEKEAARKANKLVKNISSLYGQLIKTKVEYIIKIKNVLTLDQRLMLIHSLDFEEDYFEDDLPEFVDLDVLEDLLELSKDQMKKILRNRTDMQIKKLKIELDIENKMLDLEDELLKDEVNSDNVDKILLALSDLGTKLIDNRVKYQLKSKDVLTAEQKQKMLHSMMLMSGPGF